MKDCVAAGEYRAKTVNFGARKTLEKIYEFWAFVQWLNQSVCGNPLCIAGLVDVDLMRFLSVITLVLFGSQVTISEVICDSLDGFSVKASFDALGWSAWDLFHQA